MKKIFSICLILNAFCLFAGEKPFFEKTDEKADVSLYAAFSVKEPLSEEDYGRGSDRSESGTVIKSFRNARTCPENDETLQASYVSWTRYKSNFGIEKIFVRFPQSPIITQTSQLLTAYAYDGPILYSLNGYFPPMGNINPIAWFEDILFGVNQYPFQLLSHTISQAANGDWVMDYISHDYVQNSIFKARAIATPFNGYTLQCLKPNGCRDCFDYFLDTFWIRCDCN